MIRYTRHLAVLLTLALASVSFAQRSPSSIRGYKVYQTKIVVHGGEQKTAENAVTVKVGEPRIVDVGLAGLTLEATAEVSGLDRKGSVDLLMFKDVVVNAIPMSVADYEHPFELKKDSTIMLPLPVRGTVGTLDLAQAAYKEATASRKEWQIAGTVLVFGRFKKMGITFKRVIPVPFSITIQNPLKGIVSATHP